MSSFKDEEHKKRKMSYPGNFPITYEDLDVSGNKKEGYIKADQLYYFNKDSIDFIVIGSMKTEAFNLLISFIEGLETPIEHIVDNL